MWFSPTELIDAGQIGNWLVLLILWIPIVLLIVLKEEEDMETAIIAEPDVDLIDRIWLYPNGREGAKFAIDIQAWERFKRDIKSGLYDD